MTAFYFDSSGLVKLYVPEKGTAWVTGVFAATDPRGNPLHVVGSSNLAIVEVAAAFARLQRMKAMDSDRQRHLVTRFAVDQKARLQWIRVDDATIDNAAQLTQRHPLRGYDAVHLAAALGFNRSLVAAKLSPAIFVSADDVLCRAAESEGLQVENPNTKS